MVIKAAIGGAVLAAISGASASGRAQAGSDTTSPQNVSYDTARAISPSSATSTVSASSVPQAMERLTQNEAPVDISLGSIYASGRFGTSSTSTIWSSALSGRLRLRDLTLSASLPWMRIQSRSTIFTSIDATPVLARPETSSIKKIHEGFGDLTVGAAYTIAPASLPVEMEFSARAKLRTATRSSRLSSGENDYAIGVDLSAPLGAITPFASLTYRFLGDTATYKLRDGPAASIGASYGLGSSTFLVVSYHYSRAATRLVVDAHELFTGVSTHISGTPMRVTGFATAGLSNGAPKTSAGLALSVGLRSKRRL